METNERHQVLRDDPEDPEIETNIVLDEVTSPGVVPRKPPNARATPSAATSGQYDGFGRWMLSWLA